MMDHRAGFPVLFFPFQPQSSGFRPSRVASAPQKQNRTAPYRLPAPNASHGQACRAPVFPWRPGGAQSWLIPLPQRGKSPWTLLAAGRPLTHFQGNSPGSVLDRLPPLHAMCSGGTAPWSIPWQTEKPRDARGDSTCFSRAARVSAGRPTTSQGSI